MSSFVRWDLGNTSQSSGRLHGGARSVIRESRVDSSHSLQARESGVCEFGRGKGGSSRGHGEWGRGVQVRAGVASWTVSMFTRLRRTKERTLYNQVSEVGPGLTDINDCSVDHVNRE